MLVWPSKIFVWMDKVVTTDHSIPEKPTHRIASHTTIFCNHLAKLLQQISSSFSMPISYDDSYPIVSMLPKRRFWTVEETVWRVLSKHFSKSRAQILYSHPWKVLPACGDTTVEHKMAFVPNIAPAMVRRRNRNLKMIGCISRGEAPCVTMIHDSLRDEITEVNPA